MQLAIKIAIMSLCLASCLAASANFPVVCSGFDMRGDSARVELAGQKLTLQISRVSGGPVSLSTSVSESGLLGCEVFFDKNSNYMAVGLSHRGLASGPLHIVVTDLMMGKLAGDFTVPNAGLGTSLTLIGFLRDKSTLVVLGSSAPDHPKKTFSTALFRVTGEQENSPETHTLPADAEGVGNRSFADPAHNRLWFKSSPQFCPLRSIPLVRDDRDKMLVDVANDRVACDVGSAIGYPNENTLIAAVSREPSDLVSRIDLAQHRAEQLALPATGGPGSYTAVGRAVLSPDGQIFAVCKNLLSNSFSGNARSRGTEVDVVQVSPLKFIGKIRLKPDTDAASISIDHRGSAVTVLSFQNEKWSSLPLKKP